MMNAPLALALLLVPKAREVVTLPAMMTLSFSCDSAQSHATYPFILQTIDSSVCQVASPNGTFAWTPSTSSYLQCGTVCPDLDPSSTGELPLFGLDASKGSADSYRLPDEKSIFTPFKDKSPSFQCSNLTECVLGMVELGGNQTFDSLKLRIPLTFQTLKLLDAPPGNLTQPKFGIGIQGLGIGESKFEQNQKPRCGGVKGGGNSQSQSQNGTCRTQCLVQFKRSLLCSNKQEDKVKI